MTTASLSDFERSVDSKTAATSILEVAAAVEQEEQVSLQCYEDGPIHAVYARESGGSEVTYGLGKGPTSFVGAYGECIEHLYYQKIGDTPSSTIPCSEFCDSQAAEQDIVLQYAFSLDGHPTNVPCILFRSLINDTQALLPSCFFNYHLLEPFVEQSIPFHTFLSRYVTTSGTAFGLTESDATLHALNEIIERHITSIFFLDACGYGRWASQIEFELVELSSLPSVHHFMMEEIRNVSGGQPQVCIAQTPFGGWWAHCLTSHAADRLYQLPQWGAGFSLSIDVALYRAASECLQMLIAYSDDNKKEDETFCRFLKQYPQFGLLSDIALYARFRKMSYQSLRNRGCQFDISVTDQIKSLSMGMEKRGATPYKHVVKHSPLFNIVTVYAPNLERFYNITKCAPVLPIQYIRTELPANKMMHRSC